MGPLTPAHRAHLRAGGLSEDTIERAHLHSVTETSARLLGYAHGVSGLCIPYPGCTVRVDGKAVPYTRVRVDQPRESGRRYENPLKARLEEGLPYYPYVPHGVHRHRKDPRQGLVLTEGEKKALALTQAGWPAIGLPGVFLFTDPTSQALPAHKPLHPDLMRWAWRGREVWVGFDSDRLDKDGVGLAAERLCRALTAEGAVVRVLTVPALPDLDKTGLDDWLVRTGLDPAVLMEEAEPWRPGAWLVDRIPEATRPEALAVALASRKRDLDALDPTERTFVAERLVERFPGLPLERAEALLRTDEDDALPEVVVSGRQSRELISEAWQVLRGSRFGDRLFRYGSSLVRVVLEDEEGGGIEPLDPTRLTGLLLRSADWVRETEEKRTPARVPPDIARDMVALPVRSIPRLVGLTSLPVLRRDGSVLTRGGFDPDTGLFCRADLALELPEPTPAARREALAFLQEEVLGDFPLARDSDQAHALALLLLPVVRHLVDGPTPLHLVEAPTEGTGKTLLADVAHVLATGRSVDPTTLPRSEEEVRKKLTALLLAGPSMVLLDNIDRSLDSGSLAAVLTRDRWADRILGQSSVVHLPNRAVWVATANNPTLSRELARRCCRVRLDAGLERPWLREGFRHPDLSAWVRTERHALVSAALTLARGWLADGAPDGPVSLGSFSAWSRVLGGLLASAGVSGFLDDRDEPMDTNSPEEALWEAFVLTWWETYAEEALGGGALLELAVETGLWSPDGRSGASDLARFSRALSRRRDRVYGEVQLTVRRDNKRKQNQYVLAPVLTP